ncbi:uncharacterized protein METZ01_LOCUS498959, partial [marine metagenome]
VYFLGLQNLGGNDSSNCNSYLGLTFKKEKMDYPTLARVFIFVVCVLDKNFTVDFRI